MAAATGRDIYATSPRDSFTGVAARSVPVTRNHPLPLPTPPNSISPALPPHGLKAQLQKAAATAAKLEPIDSDLDLHDASDDDNKKHCTAVGVATPTALAASASVSSAEASNCAATGKDGAGVATTIKTCGLESLPLFESADAISPTMLAKYHLPDILLNHGPLAIRYIIGHLTASVPGFSFIPPARSRRLVVAALEGKGHGAEGGIGGVEGEVRFQKVSWGVWGARRLAPPTASVVVAPPSEQTLVGSFGIPIASVSGAGLGADRLRQHSKGAGALYRESAGPSNNKHAVYTNGGINTNNIAKNVIEDEADKMSLDNDDLDGPAYASCSEAPDADNMSIDDDPDSMTDDEDWGAMGAAALRAASFSNSAATAGRFGSPGFQSSFRYGSLSKHTGTAGTAYTAGTASSIRHFSYDKRAMSPHALGGRDNKSPQHQFNVRANSPLNERSSSTLAATGFSPLQRPLQRASDEQERDAIEALLSLGSV